MSCGPDCTKCSDCAQKNARTADMAVAGDSSDVAPIPLSHVMMWTFVIGVASGLFVHAITWRPNR